jgi:hypothetical protein
MKQKLYTVVTGLVSTFAFSQIGHVGIGTATPSAKLQVTQNAGSTTNMGNFHINNCGAPCGQGTARNIVLSNENPSNSVFASLDFVANTDPTSLSGASIVGIDRDVTSHYAGLQFWTRNATDYNHRLTIKPSGNIGIGTAVPAAMLSMVNNQAAPTRMLISNTGPVGSGTITSFGLGEDQNCYAEFRRFRDGSGRAEIGTKQASPFAIFTSDAERIRVDKDGNMGIGTNAPTEALDVNGKLRVRTLPNSTNINQNALTVDANGVVGSKFVSAVKKGVNLNDAVQAPLGSLITGSFVNNACDDGTLNKYFSNYCMLDFDGTFHVIRTAGPQPVTVTGAGTATVKFSYTSSCTTIRTAFIQFAYDATTGITTVTSDNEANAPVAHYNIR